MLFTSLSSANRVVITRICAVSVTAALAVASPLTQERTTLHPRDARLYLSVPDFQSVRAAYGRTALGELLRDDRLSALATALGGGREDLGGVLLALYTQAVEAGDAPPVIELCLAPLRAASVSVTLHGVDLAGLASEMSAAERAGEDPWALAAERSGVLVDLEFESAEAAAGALELLLEWVGAEARVVAGDARSEDGQRRDAESRDAGSRDAESGEAESEDAESRGAQSRGAQSRGERSREPAPEGWRGVTAGKHVALFLGAVDEDAFARRVRGEDAGLAALDETARTRLDRRGVTVIEGFSSLAPDLSESPELTRISPLLYLAEGLLGPPAAMLLRGGSWRVGLLEDGRFLTEGFHPLPAEDSPAAILGAGPLDGSALDLLQPEARIAWAARLEAGPLASLFEPILDSQASAEFVGSLGSTLTASLLAPRSLVTAPPVQFAVALDDHEAFLRGVEVLLGELEGRGIVSVERGKYRKVPLYTLRIPSTLPWLPIDLGRFLKPTLAILEDRAVVCFRPTQTKREVRRILTRDPGQPMALERAELPPDVTELATADWIGYLARIYSALRAFLPLLPADQLEAWSIDPESLPDVWSISRHFQPSVRWKRVEQGGVLHHLESSFGPEAGLGLALGALWFFGVEGGIIEQAWTGSGDTGSGRPGSDRTGSGLPGSDRPGADRPGAARRGHPDSGKSQAAGTTQAELTELRIALTLHRLDQGHFPQSLQQITLPTANYPGGFLNGSPLPKDGWGNAFRYALEDGTYRLWSTGADGIDQNGGGDDLRAD